MRYTAKRFGWDEVLNPEQEADHTPYSELGYESDDIEGGLEVIEYERDGRRLKLYLVGGQEADPKSIRPRPKGV
jgi:hypothetical protein